MDVSSWDFFVVRLRIPLFNLIAIWLHGSRSGKFSFLFLLYIERSHLAQSQQCAYLYLMLMKQPEVQLSRYLTAVAPLTQVPNTWVCFIQTHPSSVLCASSCTQGDGSLLEGRRGGRQGQTQEKSAVRRSQREPTHSPGSEATARTAAPLCRRRRTLWAQTFCGYGVKTEKIARSQNTATARLAGAVHSLWSG